MNPRPSGSLLASLALHLVLGAALVWLLSIPSPFWNLLDHRRVEQPVAERLRYVGLPNPGGAPVVKHDGGDGRPIDTRRPPPKALVAPVEIPATVPVAPPKADEPVTSDGGSGPVLGTGGPTEGVVPSFGDARVWAPPGSAVVGPSALSPAERLDSALTSRIAAHNDSLGAFATGRAPGDWTIGKDGKKYGIDPNWIYFGKLKVPTALLALLPLSNVGNPMQAQRNAQLTAMHNEIQYEAQRSLNEDEFRDAVKRIRERKDRERQQQEADKKKKAKDAQPQPQDVTTAP